MPCPPAVRDSTPSSPIRQLQATPTGLLHSFSGESRGSRTPPWSFSPRSSPRTSPSIRNHPSSSSGTTTCRRVPSPPACLPPLGRVQPWPSLRRRRRTPRVRRFVDISVASVEPSALSANFVDLRLAVPPCRQRLPIQPRQQQRNSATADHPLLSPGAQQIPRPRPQPLATSPSPSPANQRKPGAPQPRQQHPQQFPPWHRSALHAW